MNEVELSVRLRKLRDGEKGQSSFKSFVFKRADAVTTPTGGSFSSPIPSGWSDGIPPEDSSGNPCWMSSRTFTSDGKSPQDANWSTPQKIADTSDFDVCFSAWSGTDTPPDPTVHDTQTGNDTSGAEWHDTGTENDIWMATSQCSNGKWGTWNKNKIKGEKGQDGVGAYALDLDNENINIGLTSNNGNLYPASGYNTGECNVYVAGGSGNAALSRIDLIDSAGTSLAYATPSAASATWSSDQVTSLTLSKVESNSSKISLTLKTDVSYAAGARLEFRLKGTITVNDAAGLRTVEAYKVLNVTFQPPGADGVSPVIYELVPSADFVKISGSTRTPSSVTCGVSIRVGSSYNDMTTEQIADADLTVKYSLNGGSSWEADTTADVSSASSLTWRLYKGTVVYDQEQVAFVKDGTNGTSPIIVDLDNDNDTVAVDATGAPITGELPLTSQAHLYVGATADPSAVTWAVEAVNCTAEISSSGLITVTAIVADKTYATATAKATYGGQTYQSVFSISKAYPGPNGESPVIYSIEPSVNSIHKASDGTMTPATLTWTVYRREGGVKTVASDKYVQVKGAKVLGTSVFADGTTSVGTQGYKSFELSLYEDSTKANLLDRETVFVISDGAKGPNGENGEDAWSIQCNPQAVVVNQKSTKVVQLQITAWLGDTQAAATSGTYPRFALSAPSGSSDSWLSWGNASASGNVLTVNLTCTPNNTERSSSVTIPVTLYKSSSSYIQRGITIPVSTYRDGDPGPAGLVYRVTEWEEDKLYRNDTSILATNDVSQSENGLGVYYLDVVVRTDDRGQRIDTWSCKVTHPSTASNMPPPGASNDQWQRFDKTNPIYTPLLLADGAVIGFLQGNSIKIFDAANNLKAGVSAASGDYPVFYANPQKYPVGVVTKVAATASSTAPASLTSYGDTATVKNGYYLHTRCIVVYSDGTSDNQTRSTQNTGGSDLSFNAANARYAASSSDEYPNTTAAKGVEQPNITSAGKPYLWVWPDVSHSSYGPYKIAQQTAGGVHPEHSVYQQYDNGNAQFGGPSGAKLLIEAAPSSGLPKINIYDELGSLSAQYDGTKITDKSELYGSGSPSASLASGSNAQASILAGSEAVNTATYSSAAVSCTSEATALISEGSATLTLSTADASGTDINEVWATAEVLFDNTRIGFQSLRVMPQSGITYGGSASLSWQAKTLPVSAGSHTLSIRVSVGGSNAATATATVTQAVTAQLSTERMMCRYFANGLAIGSSNTNYCMIWNNGGSMNFVARNQSHGLKVDADGAWVLKNGVWKNLESLFS